jgi:hypothetical protein
MNIDYISIEPENDKRHPFPCLREHVEHGFVVWFSKANSGVVVSTEKRTPYPFALGFVSDTWNHAYNWHLPKPVWKDYNRIIQLTLNPH